MSIGAESSVQNLTRVRLALAAAVTLAALSLAACGGDSSASSSAAPASTPASTSASGTTSTTTGKSSSTSTGTTTAAATTSATGTSGKSTSTGTTTTPSTGASSGSTTTSATSSTVKSIKQWVSCSETIDESGQLAAAITAAAHNAFVLQVDCPVRFHTGKASLKSINVPEGVTIKFTGAGEFLTVGGGPPALDVDDPQYVTFVDYNQTFL